MHININISTHTCLDVRKIAYALVVLWCIFKHSLGDIPSVNLIMVFIYSIFGLQIPFILWPGIYRLYGAVPNFEAIPCTWSNIAYCSSWDLALIAISIANPSVHSSMIGNLLFVGMWLIYSYRIIYVVPKRAVPQ